MQIVIGIVLGILLSLAFSVVRSKLIRRKDPVAQLLRTELVNLKGKRCGVYLRSPDNSQRTAQSWLESDLITAGMNVIQLNASVAEKIARGEQWLEGVSRQPIDIAIIGFCRERNYTRPNAQTAPMPQNCTTVQLDVKYYNAQDGDIVGTFCEEMEATAQRIREATRMCLCQVPGSLSRALTHYSANLAD